MEPVRLWAAVEFTAQSGSTDALLGHAAQFLNFSPIGFSIFTGIKRLFFV